MQKISAEYVTIGHPDRMCDLLAAKLIEKIQDKDKKKSHAAIEVFATKDTIIFGGEATTTLKINKKLLKSIVKEIFSILGYNNEKRKKEFGKDNIPVFSKTKIINKISTKSFSSKQLKNYFKNTKYLKSAFGIGSGGKIGRRMWFYDAGITTILYNFLT